MLKRLEAPDDVLAVQVGGVVSEGDVAASIMWMDAALAGHDTLHVFAEVEDLTGVDPSGLVHAWTNGVHLLTRLRSFGRVAIVSEDRWIRVLARLESAALPGISYRVVGPRDRDAAFKWVCGEGD